jgi:hypothetical protein
LTAPTSAARERLTDDQLQELMATIGRSDSIELKLTVADAERHSVIVAADVDPLDAQIRQVVFFDTPDLRLSKAGVVARARRGRGKTEDSTIKLRPVAPQHLTPALRSTAGFRVEVDAMPGSYACSASLSATLKPGDVTAVMRGKRPIRKLFSKAQRAFYAAHAPAGVALDDLSILGPIFVLKLKGVPNGFERATAAEVWLFPDATMTLELSSRTVPSEVFQVAAEALAFLAKRGISSTGDQETKTKRALRVYSKRLLDEQRLAVHG